MIYVICLLRKTFRGGSRSEYLMVEKPKDDNYDEIMEEWGESSDGGHEDGYRVYLDEIIYHPTEEIMELISKDIKSKINYSMNHVKYLRKKLVSLTRMEIGKLPKEPKELYDKIKTYRLFKRIEMNKDPKFVFVFEDGSIINVDENEKTLETLDFLLKRKYLKTTYSTEYKDSSPITICEYLTNM